jgi:hypothetical protein
VPLVHFPGGREPRRDVTANRGQESTPDDGEDTVSGQPGQVGSRSAWWPALYAAAIAFTVVVSSGATLLTVRMVEDRSAPSPPPRDPIGAVTATPPPEPATTPATTQATTPDGTRLALVRPRLVLDGRTRPPLPAGARVPVPLTGLPRGSTAALLDVSVLGAARAGELTLTSTAGSTTVLRLPAARAQTSATTVVTLGPDGRLSATAGAGGRLVVTLVGGFVPAGSATSGRILPTPTRQVLLLRPATDGNRATLDPARLVPRGTPPTGAAAVLLTFTADVGGHGGTVVVNGQQVFWGATNGIDRVRRGFLVVPLRGASLPLMYHAGTRLQVAVVGIVTGAAAPQATKGLAVLLPGRPLPPVRLPATGRAVVALGEAVQVAPEAATALVTATTAAPGQRPRSVLGLLPVGAGAIPVSGAAGAQITLTPRALLL